MPKKTITKENNMKILVFAPHNDDEVLGVGGTIAKYVAQGNEVIVCEVTSGDETVWEMISNEAKRAHSILGVSKTIFLKLPVIGLKDIPTITINSKFGEVVNNVKPNVVFIPHKGDIHIDHQETSKAAMVALRPIDNPQLKAIYAYETLSETEWNIPSIENVFIPNTWNDISDYIEIKKQAMECYSSQLKDFPNPRSLEAIESLSKLRGSTVGMKNAECFISIRQKL
jgi:LmbE family N-acetylglucosaminyl deacetylase